MNIDLFMNLFFSVPDQPQLVVISPRSLVVLWNTSIALRYAFNVTLYRLGEAIESHLVSSSTRQYNFEDLQPFTSYSANLAICYKGTCWPPSAMAFGFTWPDGKFL